MKLFLVTIFLCSLLLFGCTVPPDIEKFGRVIAIDSGGLGSSERSTVYFEDGTSFCIGGNIDLELGEYYIFTVKDNVGRCHKLLDVEKTGVPKW